MLFILCLDCRPLADTGYIDAFTKPTRLAKRATAGGNYTQPIPLPFKQVSSGSYPFDCLTIPR